MNHSSKILKLKARTTLMGKYMPSVSTIISMLALSAILNWLLRISGFSMAGDTLQKICYIVMNIVILLLEGLFSIGLSYFFLQMALGKPFGSRMLFYCFTHDPDRFILAAAIKDGLGILGWAPALFYFSAMPGLLEAEKSQYLLLLFLILLGAFLNLLIQLFLGQSYYILLEDSQCSVMESMKRSIRLVQDRKKQWFLLHFSFLGYNLLELGTMGAGTLWLLPYMEMIKLQFYLDLTGRDPLQEAADAQEKEEEQMNVWPQPPHFPTDDSEI